MSLTNPVDIATVAVITQRAMIQKGYGPDDRLLEENKQVFFLSLCLCLFTEHIPIRGEISIETNVNITSLL